MATTFRPPATNHGAWQLPDPDARARRRQRRLTILLAATTATIIAAAALAIGFAGSTDTDARGCPVGARPARALEFLIDQSDPFSIKQLALVTDQVRPRAEDLGIGDLLSLLVLEPREDGKPLTEAFSRCRPPRGRDVSIWIAQPADREREYVAQFATPLKTALGRALTPGEAATSPLIEAMYAIAQRPAFDGGGDGRTLVLFSDGLQHTALASFFTRGYSFAQLAERESVYLTGLRERFAGACVEMFLVSTHYPRQTAWPELESFWRAYWDAAGVQCLTIKRI